MRKQHRDMLVLGGVLLILAVVAVVSLKPSAPPAKPAETAETPTATATATPAPVKKTAPAKESAVAIDWVQGERVARIPTELTGGRNPFENMNPPPEPPKHTPGRSTMLGFPNPDPIIPPYGEGSLVQSVKTRKLEWTTWQVVQQQLAKQVPEVEILAGQTSEWVKVRGFGAAVDEAYGLIAAIDKRPPPPPYVLIGVIVDAAHRYAVIGTQAGTKTYSLYEGETLDGWTVTRITATGVTLQRKKQIELLRLAGGKA